MNNILCIGNSHANFFTNSAPGTLNQLKKRDNFLSYNMNATLAYNFYQHYYGELLNLVNNFEEYKIGRDYILLVVGEIDCRWHILKQAELQNRDPIELTRECLDRFLPCLVDLKNLGHNVIAWGGHPGTRLPHSDDPNSPIYGSCEQRNHICLEWSNYLERLCHNSDIKFVSIYKNLVNADNLTTQWYFEDYCHLNQNALHIVINKLKKLGIL